MFSLFKGFRAGLAFICAASAFYICCYIKLSPIIGSSWASFSLLSSLMPLTGVLGLWAGVLVMAARSGIISITSLSLSAVLIPLVYHLPGFCASASWAYPTMLMRVILPLLCMIAFVLHPFGVGAAPYALYWLIPVVIYFLGKKTVFFQALSATFIAHAVGSVVWLYGKGLPTEIWLGLIPIVIFERLLNAALMTVVYYSVKELSGMITRTSWFVKVWHTGHISFLSKNK